MGDIRKKKKLRRLSILSSNFDDHYTLSGHRLGSGAFSRVEECFKTKHGPDNLIYAVKIIEKVQGFYSRPKILREIDTYHLCQGHPNIIQLLEYFEVRYVPYSPQVLRDPPYHNAHPVFKDPPVGSK